ncbi:hypothetical protein ACFQZX_14315 [Mucilaginibacter litoreus]|uniref:Lipocalin-like domain-containing protein n=1 Tax=Mucilaginibacter litoreus TaxID=1048221 RepID=A0ABW3AUR8_9SPHI
MHNYKISIAALAICLLTFLSCKKSAENNPNPVADNTWTLDGKTYTVGSSSHYSLVPQKKGILFKDGKEGSKAALFIMFKEYPTTAGKYKFARENSEAPAADECYIDAFDESGRGYYDAYHDKDYFIDVTIQKDGKIAISVPQILVAPPSPSLSVTLKASVYEK